LARYRVLGQALLRRALQALERALLHWAKRRHKVRLLGRFG
jgi:hypothetical protein